MNCEVRPAARSGRRQDEQMIGITQQNWAPMDWRSCATRLHGTLRADGHERGRGTAPCAVVMTPERAPASVCVT
jgi:hypothetical protein